MVRKRVSLVLCSLLGTICIFGQELEVVDYSDLTFEDLLNLEVVVASKTSQKPIEAPSIISITTQEAVSNYDWLSINDILYKQPGFGPAQDYDRRTVSARGMFEGWNNNHILHLVDGIPMNDNLYGTAYTWENTPLFMMKNAEIIRGPGSALYGSNATNGVFAVNTLSPEDLPNHGKAMLRSGSNGLQTLDAVAGFESENLAMIIAFNSFDTDGLNYESHDGSGRFDSSGNLMKFSVDDDRESSYLWMKIEGRKTLKNFSFQYHEQAWSFQTGHGWLWWIPDYEETMKEKRRIFSIKWVPETSGVWSPELVLRYQRHEIDWNMRYYTDDAFESYYPSGMWEYLNTSAEDVFLRAQVHYQMETNGNILFGIEADRFDYSGDKEHYSNINIDGDAAPFPGDRNTRLGPWLHYIQDKPVDYLGVFGQYTSEDRFGEKLKLTLGVRYDKMDVDYQEVYTEGMPEANRTFSQVSPRLGIVYLAKENLSFKLLLGKAFRAPTPTELAGAHTWSLGSNIDELEPEKITTIEVATDWIINNNLNWRLNLFRTKFENQIAYSASNNNLSTNIYTLTSAGLETELLFGIPNWEGFINYSYAKRLDEEIIDTTIAASANDLTWDPDHKLNFGVTFKQKKWTASIQGHYQGEVQRRESDLGIQELPLGVGVSLDMDQYRGTQVDSWLSMDINTRYRFSRSLQLGVSIKNVTDEDIYLVKNIGFPFDYRQNDREYRLHMTVSL